MNVCIFQGSLLFNDNYGFSAGWSGRVVKLTAQLHQVPRLRLRGDKLPVNHYVVMACARKTVTVTRKFVPFLYILREILPTHPDFLYTRFTVTVSGQYWRFPATYWNFFWVGATLCELIFATKKFTFLGFKSVMVSALQKFYGTQKNQSVLNTKRNKANKTDEMDRIRKNI
jgi:hypothetical protein